MPFRWATARRLVEIGHARPMLTGRLEPVCPLLGQPQRDPPLGRVARQPRIPPLKQLAQRPAVVREPVGLACKPPRVGKRLGAERHRDLAVMLPRQRMPLVRGRVLEEHAADVVGIEPDRPLAGVRASEVAATVAIAIQGGARPGGSGSTRR